MTRAVRLVVGSVLVVVTMRVAESSTTHLESAGPALPPLAHVKFCMHYPADCQKKDSEPDIPLTPQRRAQLSEVNARVNQTIRPRQTDHDAAREQWLIEPPSGDCNDFAVTKRHELLERGWPSSALVLAHVILRTGEHHLVLVARANEGDLVLDNLKKEVRSLAEAKSDYEWVGMQAGWDPKSWLKIRREQR